MVLLGGLVLLQVVDGVVTLFWVSLGLRDDDKNVVLFSSGKNEHVDRVVSLLWVSLGLREIGGSIPYF